MSMIESARVFHNTLFCVFIILKMDFAGSLFRCHPYATMRMSNM